MAHLAGLSRLDLSVYWDTRGARLAGLGVALPALTTLNESGGLGLHAAVPAEQALVGVAELTALRTLCWSLRGTVLASLGRLAARQSQHIESDTTAVLPDRLEGLTALEPVMLCCDAANKLPESISSLEVLRSLNPACSVLAVESSCLGQRLTSREVRGPCSFRTPSTGVAAHLREPCCALVCFASVLIR